MTDETSRAKASSEGGQEQEPSPQATQQIVDMGSTVVKNRHGTVHCLTIVGQVEGHMVLPNNTKSINMSTCCRCWRHWRSRTRWTDWCCF